MALAVTETPSPNFGTRADGAAIDMLVVHYTGMRSAEEALARMCDPAARVSAHYMIDEAGAVVRLVPEEARAWHAGIAAWAGERDVNSRAVGIELVNPGHDLGYRDFPETQMAAFVELARDVIVRHGIPAARVLGHSDVAPARKQDPGERFDWARCARAGVGLYPPDGLPAPDAAPDEGAFFAMLGRYGYAVPADGGPGTARAALLAFRRHFRPALFAEGRQGAPPDAADAARLAWLLEAARA